MSDRLGPRARHRSDHRAGSARSGAVEEARRGGRTGVAVVKVDGRHFRSIWLEQDGWSVGAVDQRRLPHDFVMARIASCEDAADAIRSMLVRGAPLIGATAAYGIALAMRADGSDAALDRAYNTLIATRPTAINLKWALDEMRGMLRPLPPSARTEAAYARAGEIAEQDIAINRSIGEHGVALIEAIKATKRPGERVNVLTHCNAGWLATVDWGTATAPIYSAHDRGHRHSRLGRRNPAAQSGCLVDRLGARPSRRCAYRDRRQHRRSSDAARDGGSGSGRRRPGRGQRRCLQQDRNLPQGARGARQWRAVLRRAAVADHRLSASTTGSVRFRSSSAPPMR